MFDGEDEQIKKFISISDRKKIGIIPIKKDLSHIYKISEAFERNELICMHADRFIEGNKTIGLNFLGANAPLPLGPFLLAASFRVPVSFVFAVKESINNYHLFATEPLHMVGTKREQVIENLTNKFIFELEKKIKAYPTQWYNYHKFWQ